MQRVFLGVIGAIIFCLSQSAQAAPIPADIIINASLDFDNALVGPGGSSLNNATHTGTLNLTSGGVLSSSTLTGLAVAGADPLNGALTETGDGVRVQASASTEGGTYNIETLAQLGLQNASATDQYVIVIEVVIRTSATAEGPDAAGEVEFDLGTLLAPTSLAALEILSDTIAGNSRFLEVDGNILVDDNVGSGGLVELFQSFSLELLLNPNDTLDLAAFWNWSSLFSNTFAGTTLDVSLSIEAVRNITNPDPVDIPAPAPIGLLLLGLGVLYVARRLNPTSNA